MSIHQPTALPALLSQALDDRHITVSMAAVAHGDTTTAELDARLHGDAPLTVWDLLTLTELLGLDGEALLDQATSAERAEWPVTPVPDWPDLMPGASCEVRAESFHRVLGRYSELLTQALGGAR